MNKQAIRIGLLSTTLLLVVSAAAMGTQSNTAHLKFVLGCGSGLPVCVSVLGTPTFTPFSNTTMLVSYSLQINSVTSATLTGLYLNTTVFSGPQGVTYRLNNMNATLPTVFSSPIQWRSGPFALSPQGHAIGIFQLLINGTGLPMLTVGQYDIGFTVLG